MSVLQGTELEVLEDPRPGRTAYTICPSSWNSADQRRSEWIETTLICDLEEWR